MFTEDRPIYQQLAAQLAEDIAAGSYAAESQVPSSNELAAFLQLNPATAGKALNVLVEQGVLYKKRGVGMFVSPGAREQLLKQRKADLPRRHVQPLVREARAVGMDLAELIDLIKEGYEQ
ncbi:GntR family transcriptional regulator [Arthrobacter sp. RIT-PI-e]|uniref:GntR family transcriptional regulator n=1 Tax=Arthrobacter sp. RIT-PI-e TaxID=1681197 RepID=UPI0006765758|nr:GntR family transcriptional regulator [Arthrobacter sp. RIT-PI-e]KNC19309.1 GntR family transcriptional regulator [Arthrobacter sp. RIT-PI-e]